MAPIVLIATRSFGSTSPKPWDVLAAAGLEVVQADMSQPITEARLIDLLAGVDAAIAGVVPLTAHVFECAARLKVVCMHGVGVDHIDLDAARRCGVIVANCPGANDQGVADLAIGFMISLARQITVIDREMRNQAWKPHRGVELWCSTLGLVGLGYVGRAVAKRAQGFDMRVLAYDPFVSVAQVAELGVKLTALSEVLAQADFVSLHAPLAEQTRNLIGAGELAAMKPTAYLINTARGGIVDEEALYTALVDGRIAGAALDTFTTEPPWGSPLLGLPNVVATSHIGAHTREAIERVGVLAAQNVVQALATGQPVYRVI